jgi:hypothetical protein
VEFLPFLPDGESFEGVFNADDYPTYDSTWISDEKLPKNYDAYSLKVAPAVMIESLGAKIIYKNPSGNAYFSTANNTLQRGKITSPLLAKQTEIHELGHALYTTTVANDFSKVKKLTEVMDT